MLSQVVRTFPFFDFVIHTPNSLDEVNGALRSRLMSQATVGEIFQTRVFGRAAGGVLKVRVHWLGASLGCIGEGEYCPTHDGTTITVRVRWPYWLWLAVGLGLTVVAGTKVVGGTVTFWGAVLWIWSLITAAGGLWLIQFLAGEALLRFVTDSMSSGGIAR